MRSFDLLVWGVLLSLLIVGMRSHVQPERADAQVKSIVEDAINRGSTVTIKKVDYVGGEGEGTAQPGGEKGGAVRSKTYIEIDGCPSSAMDEEMIRSQKKVEESQREMMDAVGVIGQRQEHHGVRLSGIESKGQDISAGMKSAAGEEAAAGEQTADSGRTADEAERTIVDSDNLIMQIDKQVTSLSEAVSELSSRVEGGRKGVGYSSGKEQTRAALTEKVRRPDESGRDDAAGEGGE